MARDLEITQAKTIEDLGREALWFAIHTLFAVAVLGFVWGVMTLTHPDPDSASPKIIASALAFLVPLVTGFVLARIWPTAPRFHVARYVWISGLMFFCAVCVWVLDLPTGPGLCENCRAAEKLWRTFFDIDNGSGLLSGDGLLIGAWVPLSLFGYAAGAALGLGV